MQVQKHEPQGKKSSGSLLQLHSESRRLQ